MAREPQAIKGIHVDCEGQVDEDYCRQIKRSRVGEGRDTN